MAHHIYERDGMLAVGETPWHGLGHTLAEPPATALEAIQIAGLDWEVQKQPIFDMNGEPVHVAGGRVNGQWGITVRTDLAEDDPLRVLGVVGPTYTPYQNRSLAALFQPLIEDGKLNVETVGSLFNGKRVWMLGKFGTDATIENGDTVRKYLLLSHGHDGLFSVRFGFTPIRVLCWNTMSAAVGDKESKLIRCLHTQNLNTNLEMLRDAVVESEQVFELTCEEFRKLTKRGVSRTDLREYARIIVEAPEDQSKWTSVQQKKVGEIVGAACEGRGNKGQNWWHAYNGVTEYVSWHACKSQERRLSEAWWGEGATTNKKALQLAIQMSS